MDLSRIYVFLLGLTAGLAILAMTAYGRTSPRWLRFLLFAAGLLALGRYLALFLFTTPQAPQQFSIFGHLWFGTSIGLTLPSVFAVDQLLRHPAMTPAKLLRRFSPFCIVSLSVILLGAYTIVPDPAVGWAIRLTLPWRIVLSLVQAIFVVGFITLCAMALRKPIPRPARAALLTLIVAHVYLGLDGLLLALRQWYFRPFLFSEMIALLALWYAFETADALQRAPNT